MRHQLLGGRSVLAGASAGKNVVFLPRSGLLRHSKGASWDLHLGRDGWEGLPLAITCGAGAPARNTGMAQNASAAQARHADQAGRAG